MVHGPGSPIEVADLGHVPYRQAWAWQQALHGQRLRGEIGDRILFVEHPPVFTLGRRDCAEDLLSSPSAIAAEGIEVVQTDRGGKVTYHGPGQLVVYFICELANVGMGIKAFVSAIEGACLRLLVGFGIEAARDPNHPGLWVGLEKIAAIGMHVAHGVTQHGLALNVNCDLAPYRHIVACGIRDRGVTSMAQLLGRTPAMAEVKQGLAARLAEALGRKMTAGGLVDQGI